MYNQIRDFLFKFDSELVHDLGIQAIKLNPFNIKVNPRPVIVDGISYRNPIGLGAGFDKDGQLINSIGKLGFGFMEVGTVTPRPQLGNQKPRLFRDIEGKSLINRMGFNNGGLYDLQLKLEKRKDFTIKIGGNIGKGFNTPLQYASKDYLECFIGLKDLVDYITINISSPNTLGLRELMKREYLYKIVEYCQNYNFSEKKPIPVYIKISPDLDYDSLVELIKVSEEFKINGFVVSNTLSTKDGGLSGSRITTVSNQQLDLVLNLSSSKTVIGSGGVMDKEDIESRLDKGCKLVQVWTGFVWNGPYFVRDCLI